MEVAKAPKERKDPPSNNDNTLETRPQMDGSLTCNLFIVHQEDLKKISIKGDRVSLSLTLNKFRGGFLKLSSTIFSPDYSFTLNFNSLLISVNPFQVNVYFLYPLKTSEKLQFSDVFKGCRKGTLAWIGLTDLYFNKIL